MHARGFVHLLWWVRHALNSHRALNTWTCVQVCTLWQVSVHTSVHICEPTVCRVRTCAVYKKLLVDYRWGTWVGGFSYFMQSTYCCQEEFIIRYWQKESLKYCVCVLVLWRSLQCMCVCMCVIRTHTIKMLVGYSDLSPGAGKRHLEILKDPGGLNLEIHVFVYTFTKYTYEYYLLGQ